MRVKFTASGMIYSWREGQVRFLDGEIADLPEQKARGLVKKFPQCFKLMEPDSNKMMQTGQNKCL